jgi:hypothetical protein
MAKRRAFLALFVAVGLTVSATAASAATRPSGPLTKNSAVTERITVLDGSMTSLMSTLSDRLFFAIRTLRGAGIVDGPAFGTGNQVDGIQDGPTGTDPLGAKGTGAHPPQTASTRIPG